MSLELIYIASLDISIILNIKNKSHLLKNVVSFVFLKNAILNFNEICMNPQINKLIFCYIVYKYGCKID
jgi:hypothetical protein